MGNQLLINTFIGYYESKHNKLYNRDAMILEISHKEIREEKTSLRT